MQFLKFVLLFTKNNVAQLRRKWFSLPLLLLFPFILIGLISFIIISYLTSFADKPVQIGLVDLDNTSETEMVITLLEESSQLGDFMQMQQLSEAEAQQEIKEDTLAAYILFPSEFTKKLYHGESVVVTVVGNPNQQLESYFVKELVDSAARHIRTSQANILTINYYAKQLDLDNETRNNIVLEQFNEFLLYALGKDNVLDQQSIENNATSSPKAYFTVAAGFVILTLWTLILYLVLQKETTKEIQTRMSLYGVTAVQQITARMVVTLITSCILGVLLMVGIFTLLQMDLRMEILGKITLLLVCYQLIVLFILSIVEILVFSAKIRLFMQLVLTSLLLIVSGAVIPEIYLPYYLQAILPSIFSNNAFSWLEEIMLNGRTLVDYIPLLLSTGIGLFLFLGISLLKERVNHE